MNNLFVSAPPFCFYCVVKKPLNVVVQSCDALLNTKKIKDFDGAFNGLQMGNSGSVRKLAATVDASVSTIRLAVAAGADLLIVHHGLFWSLRQPWTEMNYELLKLCVENDLAIYSSHLPLDLHPTLGNNARLCVALGLKNLKPFFESHGQKIGLQSRQKISRAELAKRLERATGVKPKLIPGGKTICERVGIVTGGAGGELKQAAAEGVDTFITGEGPHWTFTLAEELGINVFYGGHYATETFGVKALAAELSKKFRVPWTFLDHPTGL